MLTNKISMAAAAAVALFTSSVHASPAVQPASCVFDRYAAVAVSAFETEENVGYGSHSVLRGAQLYVPAKEGLTAEWLAANVQRSLSNKSSSCQPEVRDVKVSVVSAGPGFWVFLSASDARAAAKLLKWAQTVVPAEVSQPVASM
jgi:hypothetical protein